MVVPGGKKDLEKGKGPGGGPPLTGGSTAVLGLPGKGLGLVEGTAKNKIESAVTGAVASVALSSTCALPVPEVCATLATTWVSVQTEASEQGPPV